MTSKLEKWQAAGLIDAATADAIRAYEARHRWPVAQWAVVGLGLLALVLGIALVIAANWDEIPAGMKLGAHWGVTAAVALSVWWARERNRPMVAEGALFVLAGLVLGGIALQGQVYQIVAPTWQALAWWALLVTPLILSTGATRLTALGWALMMTWLAMSWADVTGRDDRLPRITADNLAVALPPGLIALSLLLGDQETRRTFVMGLREAGLALLLGAVSLAHFAWTMDISRSDSADFLVRLPLGLSVAGLAAYLADRAGPHVARVLRMALIATAAAVVLACAPHGDVLFARLIGALSFVAMWGVIGKAAHDAGWSKLFNLAVGAIAIRLFIVYFELFGSMAQTGGGLIVAGLLVIGLAAAWQRIVRRRPAKGAT